MILTYAGRPTALHSKYEVPGIRERARAFGAALYGEEVDLYRFCREHRAAYYLHEPRAALESGPDSERYVACATRLSKQSAAFRLQFAGEASRYFEPVYRNVSYCIYRVVEPADTAVAVTESDVARARPALPQQPIYDIASFGGQALDGEWFDDGATAGVIARVEEAIALLVQGQRELDAQRLDRAFPLLDRAHALNPGLIGVNTYLGLVLALGGDYARALPYCQREVAISPDLPFAYANLGFVEGNLGHYDDAMTHLRHAIAIDPGNEGARVMLAQIEALAAQREGTTAR
jgi:tetratricopeptide (TPR) repeat protein